MNSGYPGSGYASSHPVWTHWIQLARDVRPEAAHWLDIGCAYGYLVQEASGAGFSTFGVDASTYALQQLPSVRPRLTEAHAEALPFRSSAFDVVSVFDVLEHLAHPEIVVGEIARALRPSGICLGSTPDPLFFQRHEETHLSERPPSYWVDLFDRHGMQMAFRFAGEPFNMEFIAVKGTATAADAPDPALAAFQYDEFRPAADILRVAPQLAPRLFCTYRQNWSILEGAERSQRTASGPEASIYVLNRGPEPLRLQVAMTVRLAGASGSIAVQLDDRPLGVVHLENVDEAREFDLEPFLLSSGGHHLRFFLRNGLSRISFTGLQVDGRTVSSRELITSFPFDLYQRYAGVKEILELLYPSCRDQEPPDLAVFDMGGVMGGATGHFGSLSDFLPGWNVTVSDVRHCDIPNFVRSVPGRWALEPGATDVVVCLDVFEHVPPEERAGFLERILRLPRQWLILGYPCRDPQVSRAEGVLDEFVKCQLGYRHNFIAEHVEFGLPGSAEVEALFRKRKLDFRSLPSGYLNRWLIMQCVTFFVSTLQSARLQESINRYYNEEFYSRDRALPAYRRIFVVDVGRSGRLKQVDTSALESDPESQTADWVAQAQLLLQLISLQEVQKRDTEIARLGFLLGEREKFIREREKYVEDLLRHIKNLEGIEKSRTPHLQNLERENRELHEHARNLQVDREGLKRHAEGLEQERARLQSDLLAATSTIIDRDNVLAELRASVSLLETQKLDLLRRANDLDVDRLDIQKRALELETQVLDQKGQIRRLEEALQQSRAGEAEAKTKRQSADEEIERLKSLLSGRELRDLVPLLREYFRRSVR